MVYHITFYETAIILLYGFLVDFECVILEKTCFSCVKDYSLRLFHFADEEVCRFLTILFETSKQSQHRKSCSLHD